MALSAETRAVATSLARAERQALLGRRQSDVAALRSEFQYRRALDDLRRLTVQISEVQSSALKAEIDRRTSS